MTAAIPIVHRPAPSAGRTVARVLLFSFAAATAVVGAAVYGLVELANPASGGSAANAPVSPRTQVGGLGERASGYVLVEEPVGGIAAVEFPAGRRFHVRAPGQADGNGPLPVYGLSNPDASGQVAFIEDDILTKQHRLSVIRLDGSGQRTLFTRQGDAIWDHVVGRHLALSNAGGRLALVKTLAPRQMPGALLFEGSIEIVDVNTGEAQQVAAAALDDHLAWLPDGRRLLHSKLVRREAVAALPLPEDDFGAWYARWGQVPAVHVLDVDTGEDRLLHAGEGAVVAPDGSYAVIAGRTASGAITHRTVRIDTGVSTPVKIAGGGVVAILADDLYLCRGAPEDGVATRYTSNNSPLVGPKRMQALNAAVPGTERFETIVTDIDPRHSVTFGRGPLPASSPATPTKAAPPK